MSKIYTGVGSRETPAEILELMAALAGLLCAKGWMLRSGGAEGADTAFYRGALNTPGFNATKAMIYLGWNGMRGQDKVKLWHDPVMGLHDATLFAKWEEAYHIAKRIHGYFDKMGWYGQALHTRNVFQILGHDLMSPSKFVLFYAKPLANNKWKGGTNTAIQLALENDIELINLYTQEGQDRAHRFLAAA